MQIIVGIVILALSTSLSIRWAKLSNACGSSPSADCDKIASGLGGMRYCIAVGIFQLFDVGIWGLDTYWKTLPYWVVQISTQVAGGLALGGGAVSRTLCLAPQPAIRLANRYFTMQTLAALINGWSCSGGEMGDMRLCEQVYANIAVLFMEVIIAWTALLVWWYVRKHYRPDVFSRMS